LVKEEEATVAEEVVANGLLRRIKAIHHFGFRFHVECHVTSDVNKPRKFGHPLVTHAHTCTNFRPGILNSCC